MGRCSSSRFPAKGRPESVRTPEMRRKRAAVRLKRRVPRQRASGAPADRWRWSTVIVSVAVTVISVTGYVASSFTIDGLPSYQPSAGWVAVAVLQPAAAPDADTVQLLVQALTRGGQSRAAYDVVVCGPRLTPGTCSSAAVPSSPTSGLILICQHPWHSWCESSAYPTSSSTTAA